MLQISCLVLFIYIPVCYEEKNFYKGEEEAFICLFGTESCEI